MSVTDPVSDLFVRIRNAIQNKSDEVVVPSSRMILAIVKILKDEGFIKFFELQNAEALVKTVRLGLKYSLEGRSVISTLRRVSKPSRRVYVKKSQIPKVMNGFGICIVSTPKGVLNGKSARLANVGGELVGIIS